jgi:cytochrome c
MKKENTKMTKTTVLAVLVLLTSTSVSHADGDAAKGEKIYVKCKTCHDIDKGVNKVGPSLKGLVGRKAAAVPDFKYSEAMIAKGAEGVVWDEATLTAYLPDPKAFVPKTKMVFAGLKKPEDIENLIAFLKTKP